MQKTPNRSTEAKPSEKSTQPEKKPSVPSVGEAQKPAVASPVPMRTLLSQFSADFCGQIEPVRGPVAKLEALIGSLPTGHPLQAVLPELRDERHHIDVLLEKVRQQHAYVIIFGPLKSGKSTLMNAICASYVSEVTSLPAYPALVHISYADKSSFKATRYDGTTRTFEKQQDLHEAIDKAHVELTARLREIEDKDESFDPVVHMPSAFRKIDIGLATPELAASRAVLVDTPGLYSRMKFGYDQMTRDFRNTAACAIFVVKSDNLFLEQVFEEFNELLELFSRIFLIVNLDSRKKDLDENGNLVPSLESKNPGKIIDAFRNLAMSAPLKAAADDGRLRIYPVDLLDAASERIRSSQPGAQRSVAEPPEVPVKALREEKAVETKVPEADASTDDAEDLKPFIITKKDDGKTPKKPAADPKPFEIEPPEAEPAAGKTGKSGKAAEPKPLAAKPKPAVAESASAKSPEARSVVAKYSGSKPPEEMPTAPKAPVAKATGKPEKASEPVPKEEPLSSFETLRKDLVEYLNSNEYLKAFLADSVRRATSLVGGIQNTLRNRAFSDVKNQIAELSLQKDGLLREQKAIVESQDLDIRAASAPLSSAVQSEADSWREELRQSAENSFEKIVDDWWQGDASLADLREKSLAPYLRRVAEHFAGRIGAVLESKTAAPLAGLEIDESLAQNLRALNVNFGEVAARIAKDVSPKPDAIAAATTLSAEEIPVKRRFFDWILFRGARRRRSDLFGSDEDPSQPIPAALKEKRLGEAGRQAILDQCRKDFEAIWNEKTLKLPASTVAAYADGLADWLASTLKQLAARNQESVGRVEKALTDYQALHNEAANVFNTAEKTLQTIRKSHPLPFQPKSGPAPAAAAASAAPTSAAAKGGQG